MRRVGTTRLSALPLLLMLSAGDARGASQVILGDGFEVKGAPKPRVTVVGKQDAPGEGEATLVGDPTQTGASVQIVANGGALVGQAATFPLPASGWTRVPANPARPLGGYAYADPTGANGPVRSALVKAKGGKFLVKAKLAGDVGIVPPDPGTDGGMLLTIAGGDTYCVTMGGSSGGRVVNDSGFQIKRTKTAPTFEGDCAVAATSVSTTTSTSTPSTTPSSTPSTGPTVPPTTTSTTSTTSTTLPVPTTCADAGIVLPNVLPDGKKCTAAAMPQTGCNGWQTVGRELSGSGDLKSIPDGTAQLYRFVSGTTTCFYLYRVRNVGDETLNGVHCYNTTTCDVCAFDYVGKNPTWAKLEPASSGTIENCAGCHAAGPVTPKKPFWDEVSEATKALNARCAERGGPRWIGAPGDWVQQDPARKVPAPAECATCHTGGFVKGAKDFCEMIVRAAFAAGGAMQEDGDTFSDAMDCATFAAAMGCTKEQVGCP